MDPEDQVAIEEAVSGEFEGEVFFSTDGKHTIHARSSTPAGRRAALSWSMAAYDRLVAVLGAKPKPWGAGDGNRPIETGAPVGENPDSKAPMCGVHNIPMQWQRGGISRSSGRQYRGFWGCQEKDGYGKYCSYRPGAENSGGNHPA